MAQTYLGRMNLSARAPWVGNWFAVLSSALASPKGWQRAIIFAFWLSVTLGFMFPRGSDSFFSYCCAWVLPLDGSLGDIVKHFGGSDAGSYVRLGLEIAKNGNWSQTGAGPLWSPGMPALYALIYQLVGDSGPAVLIVALVDAVAWACFCYLFASALHRLSGWRLAWAAPALLFMVPATNSYLMNSGIFFSETLSTAFWGCGFCLLVKAAADRSILRGAFAGGVLLLAGLVRSSYELIGEFVSVLALIVILGLGLVRVWDASQRDQASLSSRLTWLRRLARSPEIPVLVAAILVFQAGAIAYRSSNLVNYGQFSWSFVDYYYVYPWLTDGEMTPQMGFMGGANIACKVDPATCDRFHARRVQGGAVPSEVYRHALYRTILTNPVAWHTHKLPLIAEYWTSQFTWSTPVPSPATWWLNVLDAVVLLAACALLVLVAVRKQALTLFVAGAGFIGGSYALLIVMHLEVRYLIPLQVFAPVIAALCLAHLARNDEIETADGRAR